MTKEQLFDKELDIVHTCLADLYDTQYNNEKERVGRIKQALIDIQQLHIINPVMQEGKEEKLCPRCEDELAMRENPSLSQLTKAMKEHPEGGSCIVTSDNPLHAPLQYKWCILPHSKPSQECEHNYNYSCPKCK